MRTLYEQKSAELEIASIIKKLLFPQNFLYFPAVLYNFAANFTGEINSEIVSSNAVMSDNNSQTFCLLCEG
jgi:hypothetical protein